MQSNSIQLIMNNYNEEFIDIETTMKTQNHSKLVYLINKTESKLLDLVEQCEEYFTSTNEIFRFNIFCLFGLLIHKEKIKINKDEYCNFFKFLSAKLKDETMKVKEGIFYLLGVLVDKNQNFIKPDELELIIENTNKGEFSHKVFGFVEIILTKLFEEGANNNINGVIIGDEIIDFLISTTNNENSVQLLIEVFSLANIIQNGIKQSQITLNKEMILVEQLMLYFPININHESTESSENVGKLKTLLRKYLTSDPKYFGLAVDLVVNCFKSSDANSKIDSADVVNEYLVKHGASHLRKETCFDDIIGFVRDETLYNQSEPILTQKCMDIIRNIVQTADTLLKQKFVEKIIDECSLKYIDTQKDQKITILKTLVSSDMGSLIGHFEDSISCIYSIINSATKSYRDKTPSLFSKLCESSVDKFKNMIDLILNNEKDLLSVEGVIYVLNTATLGLNYRVKVFEVKHKECKELFIFYIKSIHGISLQKEEYSSFIQNLSWFLDIDFQFLNETMDKIIHLVKLNKMFIDYLIDLGQALLPKNAHIVANKLDMFVVSSLYSNHEDQISEKLVCFLVEHKLYKYSNNEIATLYLAALTKSSLKNSKISLKINHYIAMSLLEIKTNGNLVMFESIYAHMYSEPQKSLPSLLKLETKFDGISDSHSLHKYPKSKLSFLLVIFLVLTDYKESLAVLDKITHLLSDCKSLVLDQYEKQPTFLFLFFVSNRFATDKNICELLDDMLRSTSVSLEKKSFIAKGLIYSGTNSIAYEFLKTALKSCEASEIIRIISILYEEEDECIVKNMRVCRFFKQRMTEFIFERNNSTNKNSLSIIMFLVYNDSSFEILIKRKYEKIMEFMLLCYIETENLSVDLIKALNKITEFSQIDKHHEQVLSATLFHLNHAKENNINKEEDMNIIIELIKLVNTITLKESSKSTQTKMYFQSRAVITLKTFIDHPKYLVRKISRDVLFKWIYL